VRLIDSEGKQVGIVPIAQAQEMAREKDLDLVEISATATPPVCKIMDYGKFIFQQKKKQSEAKKKQKVIVVKEVQFRPRIDEHDFDFKKNHVIRFLEHGDKVKLHFVNQPGFQKLLRGGRAAGHTNSLLAGRRLGLGKRAFDPAIDKDKRRSVIRYTGPRRVGKYEVRHFVGRVKSIRLIAERSPADDHRPNRLEQLIDHHGRVTRRRKIPVVQPDILAVRSRYKAIERHRHIQKDLTHDSLLRWLGVLQS